MQKINYITNKDLMREIHKSKVSYCTFTDAKYTDYDAIVEHRDQITPELIQKTLEKKAKPRGKAALALVPENLSEADLVFRVMTHEHIPLDPDRKRKARNTDVSYARTNFPPFKHYILDAEQNLVEVGRSHWKGDFETGAFELEKGKMTRQLAEMFMLLVERYARRGNFRGYTYNDEMRSLALLQLSQVGLYFNEAKGENPFAFYTTAIKNCFVRVLNVEKRAQSFRDDLLIQAGQTPSFTRQVESELEQRAAMDASRRSVAVPSLSGRVKKPKDPV